MDTNTNRETWLNAVAAKMAPRFAELGHPLPAFRVAIGFTSRGQRGNRVAECWSPSASADKHCEIFIRPDTADALEVASSLAHELAHAAVGLKEKHGGKFAKVCLAIGLQRPMKSTPRGPEFDAWVAPFLSAVGPLPHAALTLGGSASSAPPKQGTRMLKCVCSECGYTARTTQKWIDEAGAPHCPLHGQMDVSV